MTMKKYLIIALALTVAACSSLRVTHDYDKQAEFANYKTYAFSGDSQKMPINDLNRNRLLSAVEKEMAAKGFTKSDNPDVLVDMHIKAEEKVDATATTMGPGYRGYYGRYGYGGGFSTTSINYNEYIVGTLFVNLVDVTANQIVWQGRATKTLDENASAEKREKNINYAVQQIFLKYPPKK
jgi:ribosomal protein L3